MLQLVVCLQNAEQDFCNAAQTIYSVVWETLFQVGHECVNIREGGFG